MSAIQNIRAMRAGPGRRNVQMFSEPLAPPPEGRACALVRNHLTLIYPGRDLEPLEDAGRADWVGLGSLAIGRVERAAATGPREGDWVYWNGPHADYGWLEAERGVWAACSGAEPTLLPAGIGAEAAWGLRGDATPAGNALVAGQGMLGHLAAQWLKRRGWNVTVVENSPKRLEYSKYLGLTQKIDTHNLDWRERLKRWNPGGARLLVDATGHPQPIGQLMEFLQPGGRLVLLGPWRPRLDPASLPEEIAAALKEKGATAIPPSPAFGGAPEHRRSLEEWLRLIAGGEVKTERLLTNSALPAEAPMDLKRLAAGVRSMLGVVIRWSD